MAQLKPVLATLLICFLIGFAVAEFTPQPARASSPSGGGCNSFCTRQFCTGQTCWLVEDEVLGTVYEERSQYLAIVGCDGPWECNPQICGCGEYCGAIGQPVI